MIQEDVLEGLPFHVMGMKQVHGNSVLYVDESKDMASLSGDTISANSGGHDAIICAVPNVKIMVKTADCIPLVMACKIEDSKKGYLVAAVHAGWRSLCLDIIPKTIHKMLEEGAVSGEIQVGIGPSLGVCCSEFSNPLQEIPEKYHWAILKNNHVDLKAIALKQLSDFGIEADNIQHMDICTKCDPNWFSFRRNRCKQRFGTIISFTA